MMWEFGFGRWIVAMEGREQLDFIYNGKHTIRVMMMIIDTFRAKSYCELFIICATIIFLMRLYNFIVILK